jgi:ADP-ribose pyrophosphatase
LEPTADTFILAGAVGGGKPSELRIVHDELLLQSRIFRVVRRSYQSADGRPLSRDVVLHPGAVAIIPVVDARRICLVRNRRPSIDRTLIEIPAGTLEVGEEPAVCAARELEEETGYTAGRLEFLTAFYLSPGILSERMHVFTADELKPGPAHREANEEIENLVVELDEALAMIARGEIDDGKTIAALLYYQAFRGS